MTNIDTQETDCSVYINRDFTEMHISSMHDIFAASGKTTNSTWYRAVLTTL
jgi:hypothetical protein